VKKSERETHREIEGKKRMQRRKSVRETAYVLQVFFISICTYVYIFICTNCCSEFQCVLRCVVREKIIL